MDNATLTRTPPMPAPDFLARFERLPNEPAWPLDVWDTVLSVRGCCWVARIRLILPAHGPGNLGEVWLKHRENALPMFTRDANFLVWHEGVRTLGRVVTLL